MKFLRLPRSWQEEHALVFPRPVIPLLRTEKVLRRLLVDLRKLDEFKDLDAAFPGLTFREKGMRSAHTRRDFALRQPGLFTARDQLLKEPVVESLMLRRPSLARRAGLRLLPFLHLSSVVNKVMNPLIGATLVGV